jgi:RNase P subunit RPR2
MYERALAQQRLDARRQRFRERQRVLLALLREHRRVLRAVRPLTMRRRVCPRCLEPLTAPGVAGRHRRARPARRSSAAPAGSG